VWTQTASDLSPARIVSATPTGSVPDPVTNLQAVAGDARVDLSWTNPSSPFDQIQLVRKAGSAPANPTDGTTIYTGTSASFGDTALTNGTLYFYAAWVVRGGVLSSAARIAASPSLAPVSPVTNLQATPGSAQVSLSWTSPTSFDT